MPPPNSPHPTVWREGGPQRVLFGAATSFAGGAAYASFRSLPPPYTLRAGVACGLLAVPFFTLRELLAAGLAVDPRVASTLTGGVAGSVAALLSTGSCWKTVTRAAMLAGVGCGFVDVVLSGLDWKRKTFLVRRHDAAAAAAAASHSQKHDAHPDQPFKWPYWFPVVKEIDDEYEELLRRQQATVVALEEEQARIAILLRALESVKAGKQIRDVELADVTLLSVHTKHHPHPIPHSRPPPSP